MQPSKWVGLRTWMEQSVEQATAEAFHPLSPREMEILQSVTHGLSNKEIATLLGISHQTVKNHMTAILHKLDVEDRTQATVYALWHGWVELQNCCPKPRRSLNYANEYSPEVPFPLA